MPPTEHINSGYRPMVSVIIPVYNTERYVAAALHSITSQRFFQIEIIAVNDGSTDGSLAILEKAAREDSRIFIVSHENRGLSAARNTGLDIAVGEYVYFMDSDDLLDEDALLMCYEKCVAQSLDFVLFDADTFGDEGVEMSGLDYHRAGLLEPNKIYGGTAALKILVERGKYSPSACLNFIRREFLLGFRLRFYEGILKEDELFTPQLYLQADRVGVIARSFFKRRIRCGSITTSAFTIKMADSSLTIAFGLRDYGANRSAEDRQLLKVLSDNVIKYLIYNSYKLPLGKRVYVFTKVLSNFPLTLLTLHSVALIFPFLKVSRGK